MTSASALAERGLTVLAQASPKPLNDDTVRPGWLGFGVFIVLAVAAYFLFRSMNRQIKKIDFVEEPIDGSDGVDGVDGTDGSPPRPNAPKH